MTSTGTDEGILVLYIDKLNPNSKYLLTLNTNNTSSNKTGQALQLIQFSPMPSMERCTIKTWNGINFRGSCNTTKGEYYPVRLMYSYHHYETRKKTMFYFGSLPEINFWLPSGLKSNNYKIYITIQAVDGFGVKSAGIVHEITVKPRYTRPGGIAFILLETTIGDSGHSALELQKIRTLAWELELIPLVNIMKILHDIRIQLNENSVCKQLIDNSVDYSLSSFGILEGMDIKLINYLNVSRLLDAKSFYSHPEPSPFDKAADLIVKAKLLQICAKDNLIINAAKAPTRDDTESLMLLTTLKLLAESSTYFSWKGYQKMVSAMLVAKNHLVWTWDIDTDAKSEIPEEYFYLTSFVLMKQYEIFDCKTVPHFIINDIISAMMSVGIREITSRFLEERPIFYSSDYHRLQGYLATAENINDWQGSVNFFFLNHLDSSFGVHSVVSLNHVKTPYSHAKTNVNSHVLSLRVSHRRGHKWNVTVSLPRSQLTTGTLYDFRKKGTLVSESISVYTLHVSRTNLPMALQVSLKLTEVYGPIAAYVLICDDLQSMDKPLKSSYLAPQETKLNMFLEPGELGIGSYLLVIIDENSYEAQWLKTSEPLMRSEEQRVDYQLAVWWTDCFVWINDQWNNDPCIALSSSWKESNCQCASYTTTYGAYSSPAISGQDVVSVNEMMLVRSFVVVYLMVTLLVVYILLAFLLLKKERSRLPKRNVWIPENDVDHQWSYLLTVKTGAQRKAGTASRVFAILHGTRAMSETRQLQMEKTEDLFTRGSLCSFIWTTPEPLGDILSVTLWHDNSSDKSGWFVCEVRVVDLVTKETFVYPCYKWLSVISEDAQVCREITLETPTTFLQDFVHFLPQYASEHILWYSVFTASKSSKYFRFHKLTLFVVMSLLQGTASFVYTRSIDSSHTMMTPDLHIEAFIRGFLISIGLLPVQWVLDLVFKMTNNLDERNYYRKMVQSIVENRPDDVGSLSEHYANQSDDENILDPQAKIWRDLYRCIEIMGEHEQIADSAQLTDRSHEEGFVLTHRTTKKSSINSPDSSVLSESELSKHKKPTCKIPFGRNSKIPAYDAKESLINILSALPRFVGWGLCLCIAVGCTAIFTENGFGIPKDYAVLWCQMIYISICASIFILQPLAVACYTLYKVCSYRWFGYHGPLSLSGKIEVEQATSVWKHYKSFTTGKGESNSSKIKSVDARSRERELRLSHPPPEEYLLQYRSHFLLEERISSLFKFSFAYFVFMLILSYSAYFENVGEKFDLNQSLKNSIANGSCLNRDFDQPASFERIASLEDWWTWANYELLDFIYNEDPLYSSYKLFCDSNSVIIGQPRLRMYYVEDTSCEYEASKLNKTLLDYDHKCYPKYKEEYEDVANNSVVQYDQKFLWTTHGLFGKYGYTLEKYSFRKSRFGSVLMLLSLEMDSWFHLSQNIRALIVDFTLFHVETLLYSTVSLITEFPIVAGATPTLFVASTEIKKSATFAEFASQLFYLTAAMYFFRRSCVHIFMTRGRIWKCFWHTLDFITMVFCWAYVFSFMYRVRVAEDLNYQLKTTYFSEYLNIKGLVTLDQYQKTFIGLLLCVHILKGIWILNFIPKFYHLSQVLHKGMTQAMKMSLGIGFVVFICSYLGYMLFLTNSPGFRSPLDAFLTVLATLVFPTSFYSYLTDLTGFAYVLFRSYFIIIFLLFAYFISGIYKAIFIYTMKSYARDPRLVEVTFSNLWDYINNKFSDFELRIKSKYEAKENYHRDIKLRLVELEVLIEKISHLIDSITDLEASTPRSLSVNIMNKLHQMNAYESDDNADSGSSYSSTSPESDNGWSAAPLQAESFPVNNAQQYERANSVNWSAFNDIQSCPSELSTTVRNLLADVTFIRRGRPASWQGYHFDDHIVKFLDDVASASSSSNTISSHGKYGKTKSKKPKHVSFSQENDVTMSTKVPTNPNPPNEAEKFNYFNPDLANDRPDIQELLRLYAPEISSDDE